VAKRSLGRACLDRGRLASFSAPASTVRTSPSANLCGDQNPNRDPDARSDHAQEQMQQMAGAGASGQNLLFAHLALPLFALLSHQNILTKKSTTHNTPNPITPASTCHQNRFVNGSIMAERMSGGRANVKSTSRQPLRHAGGQALGGRVQPSEVRPKKNLKNIC